MRWDELEGDFMHHNEEQETQQQEQHDSSYLNFDSLSLISKPKDYYRILEVDYEATEEEIRSNYIRLALVRLLIPFLHFDPGDQTDRYKRASDPAQKWHPDKQKGEDGATSKFQEINEAYQVLSDPIRKQEYDKKGMLYLYDYNIVDYLNRYKGLILTCNGLGMKTSIL
ncbi:DnaJ domain-containing protein [Cynara cardunculus var. scolymus]|uniref:DnaJ domain-containing protein n=1 Tax=Cynara cardunculus var. scolymus TaxID=59895 RepID=A0A103YCY0_CYNCS|nr:DnaJ domain-containing protein [Cynara cardunculus var. scolymus]